MPGSVSHTVSADEPVVLEIGGEYGAAVVTAASALAGREIEVRPNGAEWTGRHVAFHPRRTAVGVVTAAVFPSLIEGAWQVRLMGDAAEDGVVADVLVEGGRVTTLEFPRGLTLA